VGKSPDLGLDDLEGEEFETSNYRKAAIRSILPVQMEGCPFGRGPLGEKIGLDSKRDSKSPVRRPRKVKGCIVLAKNKKGIHRYRE